MGRPVVTVASGGFPVSAAPAGLGAPVTESPNGYGFKVTVVPVGLGGGFSVSYEGGAPGLIGILKLNGLPDGGTVSVVDNILVNGFVGALSVTGGTGTYTYTETVRSRQQAHHFRQMRCALAPC